VPARTARLLPLAGAWVRTGTKDLECWQLANELKLQVYALVNNSQACRDFKFRDQIFDSARSGDGYDPGYWTANERDRIEALADRAANATTALIIYSKRSRAPPPSPRSTKRRGHKT
jgi:hypothetical protein